MTDVLEYTGMVTELGGVELGKSGKEKPRKVVIKDDPDAQYGKTFRVWSNSPEWDSLQELIGKTVTVDYVAEDVTIGDKSWTQNNIRNVMAANGNGAAGLRDNSWGSPTEANTSANTSGNTSASPRRNDDDRTLEIEAAWAVKAILDRWPGKEIDPEELKKQAVRLVGLKREVAAQL